MSLPLFWIRFTAGARAKTLAALAGVLISSCPACHGQLRSAEPANGSVLHRHYTSGESLRYTMLGVNQGRTSTNHYEALASGQVETDAAGVPVEDLTWTSLRFNGNPVELSPAARGLHQKLSLAPGFTLGVPDLRVAPPGLIGPITDLLTFYADVQLAMRQASLRHSGDHVFVGNGRPNSWADGTYTFFGQDAVDFDLTLETVDEGAHTATLIVRHVPPSHESLTMPSAWMRAPVGASPNNWAEVEKTAAGKYAAEVGRETFEAHIQVSLLDGRILSATMDNPVEVLERDCDDAALTACGASSRYSIRRQITLKAE